MDQEKRLSLRNLWGINEENFYKVLYLALIFFFLNSCYAMWRPLKTSIFAKMVGPQFVPDAKILGWILIFPLVLLYTKLIDWFRRHQIVYSFTLFHGIGGLIFYFILSNPKYGIANTATDSHRWVGWAFYFFMESFAAFFTTTFWAFADSVSNPQEAKQSFGMLVTGSKVGGILGSGLLYLALTHLSIADSVLLPNVLLLGTILLFLAACMVYLLMKEVPEKLLHGYDGAYQAEKHKTAKKSETFMESLKGSISGLLIVLKNPYVFGIFSLVFFYDFIITIFDLLILLSANKTYETAGELTAFYSFYTLCMHGVGLSIAFLGTVPLQRILGARASLFITPIFSLMLVLTAFFFPTTTVFTFWGMPFDVLFVTLILLRGTNYGLNHPTREMLYIPTTKMIKFKAKAWTDSFGTRFAKLSGSFFNKQIANTGTSYILYASTLMSSTLLCCWIVVAYFLGTRMQKAIDTNTVIGEEAENK